MSDPLLELAERLSARDRDLGPGLARAQVAAERLRVHASAAIGRFRSAVQRSGAEHLAHIEIGPVEPDDKHVDCLQCRVRRGRHEAVLVIKASGKVTLVGPFRSGKTEKPCTDFSPEGPEVEAGVVDLLTRLLEQACDR